MSLKNSLTSPSVATKGNLFHKILVANRGEISARVTRTARKMGIQVVGVYSEADREAVHCLSADESYCVGPPASAESYLNIDKIIEISKKLNVQAIHPGYGFLSENYVFAEKLQQAGIKFIGPGVHAMKSMASKSESKKIMMKAGVPVTPGYNGEDQSVAILKAEALKISYPVMIKAVMGGGGKGMRIVENEGDFEEKLDSAKREARKHFGDDSVILEKYIKRSRHIEVQIFADQYGNAVYLFERDCSVQRRHQKVIEEAPAPDLTEEQRLDLGTKAVAAAKAVQYEGAGTVEFIWDCDTGRFYFMEMNTRLQVEHPVTEMITGVDLVQWQLEIAAGKPLNVAQADIRRQGVAMEARIYAENTENNFLPDVGKLELLQTPPESEFLRVELGLRQGDQITVFYDPMIAKVIAYGQDRQEAIRRLSAALAQFRVAGIKTNVDFIRSILSIEDFSKGSVDTGFIGDHKKELFKAKHTDIEDLAIASLYLLRSSANELELFSPFASRSQNFKLCHEEVKVERVDETWSLVSRGKESIKGYLKDLGGDKFNVFLQDKNLPNVTIKKLANNTKVELFYQDKTISITMDAEEFFGSSSYSESDLLTPMPCRISSIPVKVGDRITKGTTVAVLEAMKMEHVLKANSDGVIKAIYHKEGSLVGEKQKLIELDSV